MELNLDEDIFNPIKKVEKRAGRRASSPTFHPITYENLKLAERVVSALNSSEENKQEFIELTEKSIAKMRPIEKKLIKKRLSDDTSSISTEVTDESLGTVETDDCPELTERQDTEYTDNELEDISDDIDAFKCNYKKLKRKNPIYPNQIETADKMVENFKNRQKIIQMIIGKTQSGKTGCMIEFIYKFTNENLIPMNNIYIITGLSSKEWETQCRQRFPESIKHIYHNGQLNKFKLDVEGKQNILIIIDEAHVACLKKQTINTIFLELNWKLDYMMENDIKLVQFSATPDGILFALKHPKWPREHFCVEIMKSGQNYYGAKEMNMKGKLKPYLDIYGRSGKNNEWITNKEEEIYENIHEILNTALTEFEEPKYLIFRIRRGKENIYKENIINTIEQNLLSYEKDKFDIDNIHEYTLDGNVEDICQLLNNKPKKFTFILVKEKLKCAKSLEYLDGNEYLNVKLNIGVMVERFVKKTNDSFIIQGLLGRLCGYEEHEAICFTNLETIYKYENLYDANFSDEILNQILWNSNSTTTTKSKTRPKGNINDVDERIDGIEIEHEIKPGREYMRMPVIVDMSNNVTKFNEIIKGGDSQSKENLIKEFIRNKQEFEKLYNFIINPNVKRKQITEPGKKSDKAYDKYITSGALRAYNEEKPWNYCLSNEDKKSSNWQCYINKKNNTQLIFILWSLNPELY
jgi:hypothetical protein